MYRVPFLDPCSGCGGFCWIETSCEYLVADANHASVSDRVSCSQCECTGFIDYDEDGQFCNWNENLCGLCMEDFDRRLDQLAKHLYRFIWQSDLQNSRS